MNRPVVLVGGVRLPFARMGGAYLQHSALELMQAALLHLAQRYPQAKEPLGEVALGTVFQHPAVWNFAREAVIRSGLSPQTPAFTVSRACATSLDAAWVVAGKIASGEIDSAIAGGAESMSGVPLFVPPGFARQLVQASQAKSIGQRLRAWAGISFKDLRLKSPPPVEPSTGLLMGQHAERMAQEWEIAREEQDALALSSHSNGVAAYERGFYRELVVPFAGLERDSNLRADTSMERLARLRPSFEKSERGTLTAGNSSPLSDGAACVLLASEAWAKERGLPALAYLTHFEAAAVDPKTEGLLMAPAYAVPRMLRRAGKRLQDFAFYEIHEAFAAQVLCTLKAWQSERFFQKGLPGLEPLGALDKDRLNTAGGSVALGHPFGATGARVLATLGQLLHDKGSGCGLVSVCTGGGMGTTAILER